VFGDIASQHRANLWLAYAIAAVGFYWVFGLAGRFAFCQTFMMALGGFTSAWVTRSLGDQWYLLGLGAAMAATAALAAVVGLATARAKDFYFAVATLAVTEIGAVVLKQTTSFSGPNGTLVGVSIPRVGSTEILSEQDTFWWFLAVATVVMVVAAFVERSPLAREATAARLNATVAASAGVPTTRVGLVLFALGSAMGGLSGALIAHWTGSMSTESFGIQLAIGIFTMLILGGIGSAWGPVVGAAIYVVVPVALRSLERWQLPVYGVILLVAIIALPQGIVGAWRTGIARARGRCPAPSDDVRLRLEALGRS
jgi:branched-chain amino acid transport system permease protein